MTKLYDPVHQFIHLDEDEAQFIDTLPFQRLRFIRQMGVSFLIYPGATHSRFDHSLGVMELATQIYDRALQKAERPLVDYWRKVLRLAALFHDSGHLPFSHVGEQVLLGSGGHEKWTYAVIRSPLLQPLWDKLAQKYGQPDILDHVCKISIGEKKLAEMGHPLPFSPWEKMLAEMITGDFFGADRIDYLLRDSRCTGVSYGLFDYHQLIESITILGDVLGIHEEGIEACEALLLARHFMHRRVYQHASVKSVNFHLARFMKSTFQISDLNHYLSQNDTHVLYQLFQEAEEGEVDAKAVLDVRHRMVAIPITTNVSAQELLQFQKKFNIPNHAIAWELVTKPKSNLSLTFPVILRNQKIALASTVSTLSIPRGSNSWLYLAPEYEELFNQTLTS